MLPRAGVSWSLNPRTVVKGSFGLYNYLYNDADVGLYNLNALQAMRFRWRDPDGNGDYTPGEVNLEQQRSGLHRASRAAANRLFNPDLKQPMTTEATVSFERELVANVGVRLGYVFRHRKDYFTTPCPNVLRPRSAYNIR